MHVNIVNIYADYMDAYKDINKIKWQNLLCDTQIGKI